MELTHVDAAGAARMVDVTAKPVSERVATATGRLVTTRQVIALLRRDGLPKGDALAIARIAGIAGSKRTSDLIPLCHPIALHGVTVDLEMDDTSVTITATTRTADRTGVEMEALTAVAAAGLTLYDMIKAVDRSAVFGEIQLVAKAGGRTGPWTRPESADLDESPDLDKSADPDNSVKFDNSTDLDNSTDPALPAGRAGRRSGPTNPADDDSNAQVQRGDSP